MCEEMSEWLEIQVFILLSEIPQKTVILGPFEHLMRIFLGFHWMLEPSELIEQKTHQPKPITEFSLLILKIILNKQKTQSSVQIKSLALNL